MRERHSVTTQGVMHTPASTTRSPRLRWVLAALAAAALAGCGGGSGGGGSSSGSGSGSGGSGGGSGGGQGTVADAQAAFLATVYPIVSENCSACHSEAISAIKPDFAHSNYLVAYDEIVNNQKINLSNPANSRVVVRLRNDSHNCWDGAAGCAANADTMQAAIEDWASRVADATPLPTVVSGKTTFAEAEVTGVDRADDAQIAFYDFSAGAGDTVMDRGGVGAPINLTIEGNMEWVDGGGLRNVDGRAIASAADSAKLFDRISEGADEYTLEAWIMPDLEAQAADPSNIISYASAGGSQGNTNFALSQSGDNYTVRNRSAANPTNGTPVVATSGGEVDVAMQHVVMTVDQVNGRTIYVNGQVAVSEGVSPGEFGWDNTFLFVIGDEADANNRANLWLGTFSMVALHEAALSAEQVQQNFAAGTGGNRTVLSFDVSAVAGAPAALQMEARDFDDHSYLFTNPTCVGAGCDGLAVSDIRIAVNDLVPVAAQSFKTVNASAVNGTPLSGNGSIIPKDLGVDQDVFFLAFGQLGGQSGEFLEPGPRVIEDGEPSTEPDAGVRTFAQVNDNMSAITGVDAANNIVANAYDDVRQSLPATANINAFGNAQQLAIQRLATAYCGVTVNNNGLCNNLFGACNANNVANAAGSLYDSIIGAGLANQPDRADVVNALVGLAAAPGVAAQPDATVLQAICAAGVASAAQTIN